VGLAVDNNNAANLVEVFGEKCARAHGRMKTAVSTEPMPMLANIRPRLDGLICSSFRPTAGSNAGMIAIKKEKIALRIKMIRML
jgi:hypothetical protein